MNGWEAIDQFGTKKPREHLDDLGISLDEFERFVSTIGGWQSLAGSNQTEALATGVLVGILVGRQWNS